MKFLDLLNMANRDQIHEFYKRLSKGEIYLSSHNLKVGGLLGGRKLAKNTKCQHNIFKITPARPTTGTWGVNTTTVWFLLAYNHVGLK